MSASQTNATAVNNHHHQQRNNNKANAKIVQKTTSESLRLSMNSNCIDGGNVVANGNTNCSSGLTTNVVSSISNSAQHQQIVLPPTSATLLMTNNGKFQTNSSTTTATYVTLPDINMDLKPKTSSYQITSITVGTRTSADEDSADDLDESHTTDENSRITDMENETPSYSEDSNMYSKDDVFATAYAHGIPIMQNNMSADLTNCVNSGSQVGGKKLPSDVRVNCVTTATVDKNKGVEIKGSERFKVVKIESIEPFKRGRWTCMDYLDQSAKQVQMNFGGNGKTVATNDSGVVIAETFSDATTTTKQKKQGKTVQTEILPNQNQNTVPAAAHLISGQSAPCAATPTITNENTSPGQTLQQPLQNNFVVNNQNMQAAPVLQQTNSLQQEVHQQQQQQQQQPQQQQQQPQQHQTQPVNSFHHPVSAHNVQQGQSLPPQIMSHVIPQMQQNHQIQGTQNAVPHQMAVSHGQLPNFQQQQQQPPPQQQQQQYSNTSMSGSQSAHNTQTIPMQQIHEIHQYHQQYQNNLQNQQQQAAQQYYSQITTDNSNNVYQKQSQPLQQQQQQQPQQPQPQYPAQMQQFSGQYQQQIPTNQQQFQSQPAMPTAQQMQMQTQQPQVSYPHGQTLPANALQGIVTTGTHMAGLPITSQIPPTMVNVSHQQAMSMGHLPNNIELNINMPPSGMNPMTVNHPGFIPQQQPVQHSQQQAQMHSQPASVSSSMHIQPTNQNYANQNQTINASNVAAVPYSIAMQATHDTSVLQQATSQMNSVNNVNLQPNYVNSTTIPTQPTTIVQQTQPVLVQPIQATVVTNPNRNNVIYSEAGTAAQNLSNVITSSLSTNAPIVSNANNVNANISVANANTNNDPDTVSVDGPTKMPVVNATAATTDDGQSVDESESNSNELEPQFFVLPLNEITLEPTENVYTNMVMQNPLEISTNLATVTNAANKLPSYASTTNYVAHSMDYNMYRSGSQPLQSSSYTTQSLKTPIKGIIPRLRREESEGIPIPGRAQSHDDIRMFGTGSGYNSPNSNYCISPNSPRGQYMYGCSPIGMNSSPPINYNNSYISTRGGVTVARRALSRATSPLSSSVPSNTYITNAQKISSSPNNRNIAASSNSCSSASGTSAVAIDNKIEQAMDLVKSHLMFAVREEVEVLKEKISELMDRINQLEVENTILKANASQETLTKLTTAAPTKTTHTATNSNPSNGPIS